jgi:DNA-binding phage protein
MAKGPAFGAAKYRNNPKMIAKYLNDALATDDSVFATRAIGNLAAPTDWGPLPNRRT